MHLFIPPQPIAAQITIPKGKIAQVTSVDQLQDVQPKDWAFQALQQLVERYGCISGYPNGTFLGNDPAPPELGVGGRFARIYSIHF